ncbi:hypothetical protein ASPCAL06810 [Aspergillus calidoustus]|uniref:C2H2-type domain-containing protein n=1 Tax=Aspergillus calidoustus TaxID=454130 RepID=A0A0U5G454_ASPCI|nr:hypothetical protein ASPCAL06810 [Aspergillus calidoustus]
MADEQFPWLDWPPGFTPSNLQNLPQHAPRAEDSSDSHWRSPFYNSATTYTGHTPQVNNSSNQSQFYPTYQQQEESFVRLEDVVPYPSYRWGPPPTREYSRPTSSPESTSGLPAVSLTQQSPTRSTSRQLPTPVSQSQQHVVSSGESHAADNMYSGHDAKRRRLDPPLASQAPSLQNTQTNSSLAYPSSNAPSRTSDSRVSQPTTQSSQPTARRISQPMARPGSQYISPAQARATPQGQQGQQSPQLSHASQAPQRTSSPATSQTQAPRATQYAQRTQPKAPSRAPSSASPQTTAQNLPGRQQPYASPNATAPSLPQFVQPSATQIRTQQPVQRLDSTQSRKPSPQNRLPAQNAPKVTVQSTTQQAPQHTPGAGSQPAPRPVSRPTTQASSQPPPTQPVPRPAAHSATPPLPHHVQQTLPQQQRPPPTQTAPPKAGAFRPPQTTPQMAQAPHTHPPSGPYGNLTAFSYQPQNPADRSHLKRRLDIVSRLNEKDAAQKITYDPKTIARDILIAAGRHPTEPSLNHHLLCLRNAFYAVDMNSDLATFKWDLVDPGQPSRDMAPQAPSQGSVRQTSQTAPQPALQVAPPPSFSQFSVNLNNTRPPQQQQHPNPQQTSRQQPPQPKPQPIPKPPQVQLQAPPPQLAPAAPPEPQAKASAPSTPNSGMEKRRRGRPPGSTNKPKVAVPPPAAAPAASYPVFACHWGNCQLELHNLDLLKKHLFKKHVSFSMVCGWKGCTVTGAMPAAELMKHVKQAHLDALAWKLGDGPVVPTSVDRESKTVPFTIPESNHPGNEDSLIFPASYSSIRAFNRVHGKNTQQEKAREIMKAVERLKEHIGVGLDPGGCELAIPVRNQRVSNDEDVYEVRSE